MTAPNLKQGANLTIILIEKNDAYWTNAQKAIAAPSIVEIDNHEISNFCMNFKGT